MGPSQLITETLILRLKDGISLEEANESLEIQFFVHLTRTLASHDGFVRQFYGHNVEDPKLFVWCIDWESLAHHTAFATSPTYTSFTTSLGQIFDLDVTPPYATYTHWDSPTDATSAFSSPVTEVVFFTLPNGATEAAKSAIESATAPIGDAVVRFGKATGAAGDWTLPSVPHASSTQITQPGKELMNGVFGYASISDHMNWRQHPEMAKIERIFAALESSGVGMSAADVPGVDPDMGWFHVSFREGVER